MRKKVNDVSTADKRMVNNGGEAIASSGPAFVFIFFFFNVYLFLRETERQREHKQGRGRERQRQRIQSRLQALSTEANTGLELTSHEIMT